MDKKFLDLLKYQLGMDEYRLKKDIVNILKSFKIKIALIKEIDWKAITDHYNSSFGQLYNSFELTKAQSGLFANKINFNRFLSEQLREKLTYKMIRNGNTNYRTKELISTIDEMFRAYFYQQAIVKMNKDELKKYAERLKEDAEKSKEYVEKFRGKKISSTNLELYKNIFIKNDEYIEKDGEGNFSKATRIVLKNAYGWRNKFKAFNTFKNRKDIHTYKDFQNYLSSLGK